MGFRFQRGIRTGSGLRLIHAWPAQSNDAAEPAASERFRSPCEKGMVRDIDPETPVREVIAKLLGVILPASRHASIPVLVDDICQSYYAAPYVSKVWGGLSEGEKDVVARAVSLIARDAGLPH